jgi:uncharacterized protein YodC (DUF2158 family)
VSKKKKAAPAFSEGDIVSLNIVGAPTMIVHAAEGDQITCDWFDGKSLCRKPFHEKELVSAAPSVSSRQLARTILSIFREASEELKASGLDPKLVDEGLRKIGETLTEDAQE